MAGIDIWTSFTKCLFFFSFYVFGSCFPFGWLNTKWETSQMNWICTDLSGNHLKCHPIVVSKACVRIITMTIHSLSLFCMMTCAFFHSINNIVHFSSYICHSLIAICYNRIRIECVSYEGTHALRLTKQNASELIELNSAKIICMVWAKRTKVCAKDKRISVNTVTSKIVESSRK